ncbi:MAG: oxygenase MpaB family protein [Acidimicrobiales bacterium]
MSDDSDGPLFTAALPRTYMAVSGAAVLTTTGALVSDPGRRIAGTGLMLLDVMGFGEDADPPLAPGTRGFEAVRRVRLFHAVARRIVLSTEVGWEERKLGERKFGERKHGKPINQEDLLGTLAAFTVVTIEAMDQMGVQISPQERDDYFHLWLVIGHLLGIDYSQLYRGGVCPEDKYPLTYAEMQLLANVIFERNDEASPQGQELTRASLEETSRSLPWPLSGLPGALTRYLLGDESADMMAVPSAVYSPLVDLLDPFDRLLSRRLRTTMVGHLSTQLTRRLYTRWIREQGEERPPWQTHGLRSQLRPRRWSQTETPS